MRVQIAPVESTERASAAHAPGTRVSRMSIPTASRGMVLPFQQLHMTFQDIWYSVDMPRVSPPAPYT